MASYLNYAKVLLSDSSWGPTTYQATQSAKVLVGTALNETFFDVSTGGATLTGGRGDDSYFVTSATTKVVEAAGSGTDTVSTYVNYTLAANVENLVVGGNNITAYGNSLDNLITVTGTRSFVFGGAGDDVIVNNGAAGERFGFTAGDGHDVVINFKTGAAHDFIQLKGYGYTDFNSIQSHLSQVGNDVLLTNSATDSVLFQNHKVADFTASNFLTAIDTSQMKLTFADEFNSLSLYDAKTGAGTWKTNFASGTQDSIYTGYSSRTLAPNNEQQIYVDPALAGTGKTALGINPFAIDNGVLSITAAKTDTALQSTLWNYQYTSGLLTTEKTFAQQYGYFEIRADLPTGKGMWPAFWLLPADGTKTAELDVMENVNGEDRVFQTSHSAQTGTAMQDSFATAVSGLTSGYHTYGMLWTAETITWYVDGAAVGQMNTPADMHSKMYLLVNLAVGGDWAGAADASFASDSYKIDYVHAYDLSAATTPAVTPVVTVPATTAAVTPAVVAPVTQPAFYTVASATDAAPSTYDAVHSAYDYTLNSTAHTLILTGSTAHVATGNALDNIITGNAAGNVLSGGAGNDTLTGGAGNDVLDGGTGLDTMTGFGGNDTYIVDNIGDKVVEYYSNGKGGIDTVQSTITYTLGSNLENLTLKGAAAIDGTGNELDNVIIGNDGANHLYGLGGNDALYGGAGNDILDGGSGNDILNGGAGADALIGGNGNDTYVIDNVGDTITEYNSNGQGGTDTVLSSITYTLGLNLENLMLIGKDNVAATGNNLDNILVGNAGNNVINGGNGNDVINGGGGADTLYGGWGNDVFVFRAGEANGDTVMDFAKGDTIRLEGYGAGATATVGNHILTVHYAGGSDEVIHFATGTPSAVDWSFAAITPLAPELAKAAADHVGF